MNETAHRPWIPPTVALLLAAILAPACAPSLSDPFAPPPAPTSITVEVRNEHLLDMRIYLVRSSTRIPLGGVGSGDTRSFRVGAAELGGSGEIRLMADPHGSEQPFTTEPILVQPGVRVEWRLAHRLGYSSFRVSGA